MPKLESATQVSSANARAASRGSVALPWWLYTLVILGSLLLTVGALIAVLDPAMLVPPHTEINSAVHIYAGYLFSRNLAIVILLIASLSLRAERILNAMLLLFTVVQLLDAIVDCFEGRWLVAPGVLILGLLFFLASVRLSGHPFWRKAAWLHP